MPEKMKRIISINDLSVFGKCSQTVAIPVLSRMGFEVCPVITAYLSAHTAFENPVITDMTDSLKPCLSHLSKLGADADVIYTGYIYKPEQFPVIQEFVIKNKIEGKLIITDPVMADDGELYQPFTNDTVKKMRELCLFADIITPNFTEACLLAGLSVPESVNEAQVSTLVARLNMQGINGKIVITGIPFSDGSKKIALGFNDNAEIIDCEYVDCEYCGTGDVFSAVVCGCVAKGLDLYESIIKARDFVYKAVVETKKADGPKKQGIYFERFLSEL